MAETAAQKKQREAKEAEAKKAEEAAAAQKKKDDEAAQAVAAKAQEDAQNTTDADKLEEAAERVGQNNNHLTKEEREEKGLKEIEEAKENDVDPDDAPLISTVHDDVVREKLAQASTSKAQRAQAEQYRLQQEHQKALETATQRGLGFNGVRPDGESEKDALV